MWLKLDNVEESEEALETEAKPIEESKAKEELEKLDASDDEEAGHVQKIEGAHKVRLDAEKDDNRELKRRLSNL